MTNPTLAHDLVQFLLAVAVLLFALHLITKMAGVGGNAMKQLVNALLEAMVTLITVPLKLLVWLLKKLRS